MKRSCFYVFSAIYCAIFLAMALLSCSSGGGDEVSSVDRVKLTIIKPNSTDGSITISPSSPYGDDTYEKGTSLTIKAYPTYPKSFVAWTGGNTTTVNPLSINLTEDITIGASFANGNELPTGTPVTVTTSTLPAGIGSVTVNPVATSYRSGDKVTFTAGPVAGYTFYNWTSGLSTVSDMSSFETTLTQNMNLIANYVKNDWTVMVYMDGDNDLEGNAIEDLDEMEKVDLRGSGINVIALLDRGASAKNDDTSNGNWTGTRLIPIKTDFNSPVTGLITSESVSSTTLGLTANGNEELNMADPATLTKFVTATKEIAQADHYMIIFWDHGTGWRSAGYSTNNIAFGSSRTMTLNSGFQYATVNERASAGPAYRAVCYDDTSDDILRTAEIGAALKDQGISIIGFDLCLAGMIEVAYEVRNCAQYMIASPEVTPADGWEYDDWLTSFKNKTSRNGLDLVKSVVDAYKSAYYFNVGQCIAGYDLSKAEALASAFNTAMGKADSWICQSADIATKNGKAAMVFDAIKYAENYYTVPGDLNIDIGDFVTGLWAKAPDAVDYASRTALNTAVRDLVCYKWYNSSTANAELSNARGTGISVHVVPLTLITDQVYTDFAHEDTAYFVDHASLATPPVNVPSFVDFATNWCPDSTNKDGVIWDVFVGF